MTPEAPALRVAVLSELPTPYRSPLFRAVAQIPGIDVTVFYYAQSESDRDWGLDVNEDDGPSVEFLPGRAFHVRGRRSLFFHWNPSISRRLRDGGFDAVVVPGWSMPTTLRAVLTCRFRRIPYLVFSETNDLTPRAWWLRMLKRVVLRPVIGGAAAWLATGTMSERFMAAHGADPARIFRFANTPEVEALSDAVDAARPQRSAVRERLGIPDSAVVALFVARLIGAKDPLTLIHAWEAVARAQADAWLLMVGDGPEAETVRAELAARSIGRVVLTGSVRPPELPSLWAAADVFVLPSVHEPWGVVVNEAMAAGLPLVLSDRVGAGPDLLVDGENGRVFPAGDAEALSHCLGAILGDAEVRDAMGAASRQRIADWGYGPSIDGFSRAVREAAAVGGKSS